MSVFNRSNLVISQLVQESQKKANYENIQIPNESQILSMFEKNGFRSNNVVTRDQLKELFDRQYAMNNMDEMGEESIFSEELFEELWGHLELLSDSTCQIHSISQVIYDALVQLRKKLSLINGPQGLQSKQKKFQQMISQQNQLNQQISRLSAQYNYHQQKIKSQRNSIHLTIGKLKAQIDQILMDKENFEAEFKMLIVTIGEHSAPPVKTKIMDGVMSMMGLERKEKSDCLKLLFGIGVACLVVELFVLSYKNSFLNLVGYCSLFYILFYGYYTDKSVLYLILYFIFSILIDLAFVYLNTFTPLILNPVISTFHSFIKNVAMICILVSVVARIFLVIKLFPYRQIPKNIHYFQLWGREIVLNRRNKQFINSYMGRV